MPHEEFINAIGRQHKPHFLYGKQLELKDLNLDWAFRRAKGLATEEDTFIVRDMLHIIQNDAACERLGVSPAQRTRVTEALTEWLNGIGTPTSGHPERG